MAVDKVEFLEDRLRVHYTFNQPDGWGPDEPLEISYDSIPKLRTLPEGEEMGPVIPLPEFRTSIVLVERSRREPETMSTCRSKWYDVYCR